MKKIIILIALIEILGSLSVYANGVCIPQHESLKCNSGTISDINHMGNVEASNITVTNATYILGDMSATNSHLNLVRVIGGSHLTKTAIVGEAQLTGNVIASAVKFKERSKVIGDFNARRTIWNSPATIIGMLNCEDCTFMGDATIIGNVTTQRSQFAGLLTLSLKDASFSDTKINDIFIKKNNRNEDQTIYLRSRSRVHNVSFESKRGIVILDHDSHIAGIVQGGKVVKK